MTDTAIRTQIILAAISAAGMRDDKWYARVVSNARDIALLTSEKSDLAKLVDGLVSDDVKVFPGTIIQVKKEPKSTRGVVYLHTGTDHVIGGTKRVPQDPFTKAPVPEGIEFMRTDRTDSEVGRSLAVQCKTLIGHKVLVHMKMEVMDNGNKVRTLVGVVDQGLDPEYAEEAA